MKFIEFCVCDRGVYVCDCQLIKIKYKNKNKI